MHRRQAVLILHNTPRASGSAGQSDPFAESDVGVLVEVEAVRAALDELGVPNRTVGVASLAELPDVLAHAVESIVFNLVEELPGVTDAPTVPAIAAAFGKAATGSQTPCLLLAQDKWATKAVLQMEGVQSPAGVLVRPGEDAPDRLPFAGPYIVKPVAADASEGIDTASVCKDAGPDLRRVVAAVHTTHRQAALVEQFVGCRELNVSVVQKGGHVRVLPIAEIDLSELNDQPKMVGYAAKWHSESFEYIHTPRILPAPITESEAEHARRVALQVWHALGCCDYARVDLRMDETGGLYVLEANPNPDISPDSGFVAALAAGGIGYMEFVDAMISNAEARLFGGSATAAARSEAVPAASDITIRDIQPGDVDAVCRIVQRTERFRPAEVVVAREVLEESLTPAGRVWYHGLVAEVGGAVVGWICVGPTPCTLGTFDIDWIAVDPTLQGRGVGKLLVARAESDATDLGGRVMVIETSDRPDYGDTRAFYRKLGYEEVAQIPHFYARDDGKVILTKFLAP